ncbi:MAG: hypothetical protein O6829_00205 [Alphaproteobacteria bacterium]|nr:hypothetical protein [Alphaproteobacteria bacterium]
MPEELRKILFPKDELQAAVVDYCLRSKIWLPNKNIDELEVRADPEAMVVLKYADAGPGEDNEVKLSRDQVAAALIRYCSIINVPLPRSAQKVLQPGGDGISLLINIDWGKNTPKK